MKLASFYYRDAVHFGRVESDEVVVLSDRSDAPAGIRELLAEGSEGLIWARDGRVGDRRVPLSDVELRAPIPSPQKYLALGGNYSSHLAEAAKVGVVRGAGQVWFNKQVSCITGPFSPVMKPWISDQFDYEGELGVIIGARCRHVRAQDAESVIAGYVVCNDMSVRDWQMRSPTHTLGKSFDTHGPLGPWLVTRDEVPDPHALRLRTWVNGELRQDANTSEMIHRIGAMVAELSTAFTLEPGDILSTGSPSGVGGLMDPPRYLRSGDVVRVEIEGIGVIENKVVDEPKA
jgi:2-keto-4-pentenoate hydratase/2-oxohepta-3-ene-1,7-dioic acid hydratase in catechol pathway